MTFPGRASGMDGHAAAQTQHRVLRRGHRSAQPAGWSQEQSVAPGSRCRHDVRQRRELRSTSRRVGRAAARGRPEVCARARSERARGAARAALQVADARARAAARAHRRQPAPLDDGAVQRRFPGGRRRLAVPARMRRTCVAREHRTGQHLCRVRRRDVHARRGGNRRGAEQRPRDRAVVARASRPNPPGNRRGHQRLRRRRHRARQLLHQPHAHLPRSRERRRPSDRCKGHSCSSRTC